MRISFDFSKSIPRLLEGNARLVSALQNREVVMKQIATYLDSWVLRNFKGEGINVGGWAPYKYVGRLSKKKNANVKVNGHWVQTQAAMLQNSGFLRASFLPMADNDIAKIYSLLPYAKYHQYGTSILPIRRMVPDDTDTDVDIEVHSILEDWLSLTIRNNPL